ncbi:MAG TPA: DUF2703 domain-containing protein [Methanoregulaceae archaeon]|nr:DUF2703 domain-containing protein [Methanoregulaceae archaeon]
MSQTKKILIEWRHLEFGEIPCGRCTDTGTNLLKVITQLGDEDLLNNVELEIQNTILSPDKVDESNVLIINGIQLEHLLGTGISFSGCSCGTDISKDQVSCKAVQLDRDVFKAIPEEMIRGALLEVLKQD